MQNKRKIAVFIDWFLPGYKAGGPITSVTNIISHLKNEFEFYVITSDTDYLEPEPYPNIKSNVWIDFDKNVKVFYISKQNINKKFIRNVIAQTDFDIAYINGIYSFYFSILPLYFSKKMNKKVVVASRGMLSDHAFSRKSSKKKLFLTFVKLFGLYNNVVFHATNDEEAQSIKQQISKKSVVKVAPNLPENSNFDFVSRTKGDVLKIVSIARISVEKNTKFALEQLLNIRNVKVRFDLYGSIYDEVYWAECKKIIAKLPENIEVNYKGTVEKRFVKQTFAKYHFSFMPSKGENFGHSILESFMSGTPVITSNKTPWQNLQEKKIGWAISLNDTEKFKTTIEFCAELSPEEYDEMSKNAFNFAKQFAENPELVEQTRKLFE